jgi:cation:H+ antiporter
MEDILLTTWIYFLLSSLFVVLAGIYIGQVSGEIGDRLHLGRAWAGTVLLSLATTMPELVSTITVALRGDIAMAIGGIIGSILFNLFILVVVDLLDPNTIYHRLSMNHAFTGILGCVLLAILISGLAFGMLNDDSLKSLNSIGTVGIPSILIFIFYFIGQLLLLQIAKTTEAEKETMKLATRFDNLSLKKLIMVYLGITLVILFAANYLGIYAEKIAANYHLSATFAGATLLGIITSLPEVTNAVTCARQKEFDLAIGNILGANAFVLIVLAIADLVYIKNTLYSSLTSIDSVSSIIMASIAIIMQGIAMAALVSRSRHQIWRMGFASILLLIFYILSLVVSYRFSSVVKAM